jgi:hypothetical protein
MIIGINGYSGSGKDTVGKLIQIAACNDLPEGQDIDDILKDYAHNEWWIEEKSGWEIKKWAGKLKTIASLLTGIPEEKFEDQEFKKTNLGPEWNKTVRTFGEYYDGHVEDWTDTQTPMTVRDFLQKLGTEGLRTGLHENTWVNALMADYIGMYDMDTDRTTYPNWIITDTRFSNEAQAIKDAGGIVIRVDRPGVSAINAHPSETGLDKWDFDHKIMNGSDMVSLLFTVGSILRKEKLI